MVNPDLSRKAAKLFNKYKVSFDKGFDWAVEIESAKSEADLSPELQRFLAEPYMMRTKPVKKHLAGQHDQSTHGHPSIGKIPAAPKFKNTAFSELDNLSPKEPEVWEAINYYVNGGSSPLNGGLRAGKAPAGYEAEFDKNKKTLEEAILSKTVVEDITVQRWMVPEGFGMDKSELPSLIGKTYADKAFMSAATMRDNDGNALAENWANVSQYNVRMKIAVPKGTNALRINQLESEILFKPNQPIYIHDVRTVDNFIEIDASMVND